MSINQAIAVILELHPSEVRDVFDEIFGQMTEDALDEVWKAYMKETEPEYNSLHSLIDKKDKEKAGGI